MGAKRKYFLGSFIFTVVCLSLAFVLGLKMGGSLGAALSALFTTAMLAILEISLSFDNAVVNAKILGRMNLFWRRMFLTVGMIIAVFGMRLVFPLVIVWLVGGHSFGETLAMTWENPLEFQRILVDQHVAVAGFGGAFLLMVFTKFFFDAEKEIHWVGFIEKNLSRVGRINSFWVAFTLIITLVFYNLVQHGENYKFLVSALMGIVTFICVDGLSGFLEAAEAKTAKNVASAGIGLFVYLNILDASFSFDGVIGAFAITNNLFIMALGLGVGAMFVRSLTIKMVDAKTLDSFIYLEHGAFWAIGALSIIMFISASLTPVPEIISGTIGIVIIAVSFLSSILYRRKQQPQAEN